MQHSPAYGLVVPSAISAVTVAPLDTPVTELVTVLSKVSDASWFQIPIGSVAGIPFQTNGTAIALFVVDAAAADPAVAKHPPALVRPAASSSEVTVASLKSVSIVSHAAGPKNSIAASSTST